jgi:hypothetical protein
MYFGVAEPVMHFLLLQKWRVARSNSQGGDENHLFSLGIHALAIYALVALALPTSAFAISSLSRFRSAFIPSLERRIKGVWVINRNFCRYKYDVELPPVFRLWCLHQRGLATFLRFPIRFGTQISSHRVHHLFGDHL